MLDTPVRPAYSRSRKKHLTKIQGSKKFWNPMARGMPVNPVHRKRQIIVSSTFYLEKMYSMH